MSRSSCKVSRAASSGRNLASITLRSGLVNTPPLNPAMAPSSASGSISIAMPRGGRPDVIANRMPRSRSARTARIARSVSTFSCVTSVPSTSARTSLMLMPVRPRHPTRHPAAAGSPGPPARGPHAPSQALPAQHGPRNSARPRPARPRGPRAPSQYTQFRLTPAASACATARAFRSSGNRRGKLLIPQSSSPPRRAARP